MRMIDADSLKERMLAETPGHEKGVVDIFLEAVAAMIDEQPTIESKTGKWIKGIGENGVTTSLFCSLCGQENPHWYDWNFCPNCGADMRGET